MDNFVEIPTNFFRSNKIIFLESKSNGDSSILLLLKLYAKSNIVKGKRIVEFDFDIDVVNDSHVIFGLKNDEYIKLLKMLEKYGLISVNNKYIIIFDLYEDNLDRNCIEYFEWRSKVFERDNYTCQICKDRGHALEAHHIIRWVDDRSERFNVDNGITLCKQCHKKQHKKGEQNV